MRRNASFLLSTLFSRVRVVIAPFPSSRSSSSFSPSSSSSSSETVEDNPVLRRTLLTRPPPMIKARALQWNSCSLIGTVVSPLKSYNNNSGRSGGFTWLDVNTNTSSVPLRILLVIWDELAEKAFEHLQRDDLIYIWGPLSSYDKKYESGKREVFHKLTVKDLNYVRRNSRSQKSPHPQNSDDESKMTSNYGAEDHERKSRDRLRLWQAFFANPEEWWDNRRTKRNPSYADFKNKFTHELLMLNPDDPTWVKKQLELYDARTCQTSTRNYTDWSSLI